MNTVSDGTAVDPATCEIVSKYLVAGVREMGITLMRTAYSTILRESMDCTTALFDPAGQLDQSRQLEPKGSVVAIDDVLNQLVEWTRGISPVHDAREYDVVVSSGEQVTVGLMALALQAIGVDARSWLGWQIPMITDDVHSRARILEVRADETLQAIPGTVPASPDDFGREFLDMNLDFWLGTSSVSTASWSTARKRCGPWCCAASPSPLKCTNPPFHG